MKSPLDAIFGIFRNSKTVPPVASPSAGREAAFLYSYRASASIQPPNGDAGMWDYEVTATRKPTEEYEVTVKQYGKREKATYTYSDFTPEQVWHVIHAHIATKPLPNPKGKSRKPKEPSIRDLVATYRISLPGMDNQGRPRLCEVAMTNTPLCLGHEGPERPSASGEYTKTWNEKFIYDPRPCHAGVCRVIDDRRGAKTIGVPTQGIRLADAINAATVAAHSLDWR